MTWLEHTVQIEVPHQVDWVWANWADLQAMPQWMRWIQSVELPPDQPHVSIWHLGANGFTFAWKSRITKQVPLQMIQWESVDGLPNRGAVRFYGRGETTILKLSVSYSIPGAIAQIMDSLFLGQLVENSLRNSLENFAKYLERRKQGEVTTA